MNEHTADKAKIKHALRYSFLNRFYDAVTSLTCREKYFKSEMIKLANDSEPGPIADIACGTGTFITMYKKVHLDTRIIGIDADENILEIAHQKTRDLDSIEYVCSYSNHIDLKEGVYVGVAGPTFETPAEYKMFRILGGDAIGMSTVPEVIVARHMGMRVFGISIITDSGVPGEIVEISHEEVQQVARNAEPKMSLIIRELISMM